MNDNLRLILIGAGAIVAVGFLLRKQVSDAVEAVENVNEGTPFEGTGVIGTLGNVTNQASGGILGRIGEAIGGAAADLRERILGIGV